MPAARKYSRVREQRKGIQVDGIFKESTYPENVISGCFGDFPESNVDLVHAYAAAAAEHCGAERASRILGELVRRQVMVPIDNGLTFQTYRVADWVEM